MTEASKQAQGKLDDSVPAAGTATTGRATRTRTQAKSAQVAAKPAVPTAGKVGARPTRRPVPVDTTVDKQQKALAEALEQAQAIQYDAPQHLKAAVKAEKPAKAGKPVKARKTKLVRDSFAMPEAEYAQIGELKKRLAGAYKKSELLRAGVAVLCALDDAELQAVMSHIERIKTGRPSKK